MLYLLALFFVFIGLIFFFRHRSAKTLVEKKEELINNWGKPIQTDRNFRLISSYHRNLNDAESDNINYATSEDIDLESLFEYVDRTKSKPGQQYLYRILNSNKYDLNFLHHLDGLAEQFAANDNLRIETALVLDKLSHKNAYYIHELFTTTIDALYHGWLAFYVRIAGILWVALVTLVIIFPNQFLFLAALGITFLNFYIHYTNKNKIAAYVHSIPQLYQLINSVRLLVKLVPTNENEAIKTTINQLASLQRSISYVNFQGSADNDPTEMSGMLLEFIKTLFVIEPLMFLVSVKKINQEKKNIETLFNHLSVIDIALSVQSLRSGLDYFSKPKFTTANQQLIVDNLYHPLIVNCVPNSIQLSSTKGVLITGSNMSGKTTFIRSLAINALLSQVLFTSCSSSYQAPFLRLFTSIRISDDLEEHKSYFQAEAISILEILEKSSESASLIIIDEIFRGTNTIERISAAKAILSYLNQHQNFTLVSTHDLELGELLGNECEVYSFEEQVSDSRLIFDYKIKSGILKNKNAIAILAALGYPNSLINDATQISEILNKKYKTD